MSLHDDERIRERLASVADPTGFLIDLFAHAPVGFAVWTADGRPFLTNKAFVDIFESEPPPGYNIFDDELVKASGMLALFQRAFAGETVHVPTFWYDPRANTHLEIEGGRRVAVSMTIFPLLKPSGDIDYIAATYKDDTDLALAMEREADAELGISQSEEDLRITLNSIGDGVIATDTQGRVTRMNPVAEQLTGWGLTEAIGRDLEEVFRIVNEETRATVESPAARVLREGVVVGLANHTLLIAKDGTERAIADSGAPIRDPDGRIRGVVLVFHDQTAERDAERQLRRSEARFRRLTDAGVIGIITTDVYGNVVEANETFLRMVGYSAHELVSGHVRWVDLTPPEWHALEERALAQLEGAGAAAAWEKEYFRKDGSRVPALVGAAVLDSDTGETIAFTLDLSERKRAEAALHESEARKAAVMEAALDAIVLMDHAGLVTEWNAAAERTFGYQRAEIVGKPLAEMIIPGYMRDRHRRGLERYLGTGEHNILGTRIEVPAVRKGGEEFPAEVAVVRIRSEGPAVFTGYIRDISERRRAAEAELLRREKEAAHAANRELEAFSYSVAHDLRTPLRGIIGYSGMLVEDHGDQLDDAAKQVIAKITGNASRMAELIDALLSLAKVSRAELRRERVNLTDLARRVVARLRTIDPARHVEVVLAENVIASGDPRLLAAVLDNLIGNAWKFTRDRPEARIEFGCMRAPDVVRCFVRDNGAGFDMAYAGRLFTPFQRLHSPADFEGTGLGLATVQRIIHRHGGEIRAESKENEGATFEFTLPEVRQPTGAWMAAG